MNRTGRGASAVETAIVVPVVMLVIFAAIAGSRVGWARAQVADSAAAAARAASIPATRIEAEQDAYRVAESDLATVGLVCSSLGVSVDLGLDEVSLTAPRQVVTQVTCTVSFSDLVLPGLPGSVTISGEATQVVDRLRTRDP